jgi:hypothetical protein
VDKLSTISSPVPAAKTAEAGVVDQIMLRYTALTKRHR